MTIKNKEIFEKIRTAYLEKKIKIVSYFSYPLYTNSVDHIAIDNNAKVFNTTLQPHYDNSEVVNIVDHLLNQGGRLKGWPRDNKTGVKCDVDGLEEPVYFVSFDSMRIVCTSVRTNRGSSEYPIIQT